MDIDLWFWMLLKIFWISFAGMEGLEEYAEERSLLNEQNKFGKEPVKEDITNNSSELLQTIKELKTQNGDC